MADLSPPEELARRRRDAEDVILALLLLWEDATREWAAVREDVAAHLRDGHAEAYRLGRRHGGDGADDPAGDAEAGDAMWAHESRWWSGLDADVSGGRYGAPGQDADARRLLPRVLLYANKWAATANEAWVQTRDTETLYDWRESPEAMHCGDCPAFAAGGPYRWDELPAVPGDGTTACLTNCQCELVAHDGQRGFRPLA